MNVDENEGLQKSRHYRVKSIINQVNEHGRY